MQLIQHLKFFWLNLQEITTANYTTISFVTYITYIIHKIIECFQYVANNQENVIVKIPEGDEWILAGSFNFEIFFWEEELFFGTL